MNLQRQYLWLCDQNIRRCQQTLQSCHCLWYCMQAPRHVNFHRVKVYNSFKFFFSSLTQGLRPFAPRSPGDVRIDDVVKFSRQGGKLSQGTVKFVGHLPGRSDVYLGVELYKEGQWRVRVGPGGHGSGLGIGRCSVQILLGQVTFYLKPFWSQCCGLSTWSVE